MIKTFDVACKYVVHYEEIDRKYHKENTVAPSDLIASVNWGLCDIMARPINQLPNLMFPHRLPMDHVLCILQLNFMGYLYIYGCITIENSHLFFWEYYVALYIIFKRITMLSQMHIIVLSLKWCHAAQLFKRFTIDKVGLDDTNTQPWTKSVLVQVMIDVFSTQSHYRKRSYFIMALSPRDKM